ncbi:MAG: putative aminoacrylate peracid reductase RutC [Candidatus Ordinivivax streblomastigis]|uniref:Putative aminoacrylate peracid reductase RutC n=1 Tax=Candidatus Ordinivivax streblomastigis TaxID=2540710 RepID=A0A5M8NUA6_9BACT|nr:MAG: putative aminoacrylate peracid reductase RutC [Candidatus Ordinivivax streblomastigis]
MYIKTTCNSVRIESCRFVTEGGIAEYHAVLHVTKTDDTFEQQIEAIQNGLSNFLCTCEESVQPVFKRYFLSDAANQAHIVRKNEKRQPPCAVSIVQQAPLDGSKIALWAYLKSEANIEILHRQVVDTHNGYRHIWVAEWNYPGANSYEQTKALFQSYAADLEEEGCTLKNDCIRTWIFVQNIDVNYAGVVEARKEIFRQHGLTEKTHYITSTGIEGWHDNPEILVIFDAYAVKGLQEEQLKFLHALACLSSTFEYGVTFERGIKVEYGDRYHVFLAGTASINHKGEIVRPGDVIGQTDRMLENIEALLAESGTGFDDVAQMIVYLRNVSDYPVVNAIFEKRFPRIPKLITLAPVCRPGWLVETECIAIIKNSNPKFKAL